MCCTDRQPQRNVHVINPSDLTSELIDELHEFLMSDQVPDDCMVLSELDGFLTGIVVGPELY